MSLRWNLGNIPDFKTVCYERLTPEEAEAQGTSFEKLLSERSFMGPRWYIPGGSDVEKLANGNVIERLSLVTHVLITATMTVDIGDITEESYSEFWLRLNMMEKLSGPFINTHDTETGEWTPRPIAVEEVKAHIGLHTNVSNLSWREWMTKTMDYLRSETLRGAGLPDDRGHPRQMNLSQVAKDTHDQVEAFERALKDHYCGDDEEEGKRHDKDYAWVCKASRYLMKSHFEWEEIEVRLEEAEWEEEAEEEVSA